MGHEVDHSTSALAEVKYSDKWSYTSIPHMTSQCVKGLYLNYTQTIAYDLCSTLKKKAAEGSSKILRTA